MRQLRVRGALVPHAPLLLPDVSGDVALQASEVTAAVRALKLGDAALVIVSPHGARSGIYGSVAGSLGPQGASHVGVAVATDEDLIAKLAAGTGLPVLEAEADHGIVVPLLLLSKRPRFVVAITVVTEADAKNVAGAVETVVMDGTDLTVIASVTTSAALDSHAPLTYRPDAERVEKELLAHLPEDAAAAANLAGELESVGGSCSAAPLVAFGTLFSGCPVHIHAYGHPFGVGYLVATSERDV